MIQLLENEVFVGREKLLLLFLVSYLFEHVFGELFVLFVNVADEIGRGSQEHIPEPVDFTQIARQLFLVLSG